MTGLNVAKGFPLPSVRANSKDAFSKLKDSEAGFWGVHANNLTLPAIYRQLVVVAGYCK